MEDRIYAIAYEIHKKYMNRDLAHDGYGIWCMAGDFLKQLIVPFDRHPLACQLMQSTVNYYCSQYEAAHPELFKQAV